MKIIALHKPTDRDAALSAQALEWEGRVLIERAAHMNGGMRMLRGLLPLLIPSDPDQTVLVFTNLLSSLIYSGNAVSQAQAQEAIELISRFAEINPVSAGNAHAPVQAEN